MINKKVEKKRIARFTNNKNILAFFGNKKYMTMTGQSQDKCERSLQKYFLIGPEIFEEIVKHKLKIDIIYRSSIVSFHYLLLLNKHTVEYTNKVCLLWPKVTPFF